MRHQTASLCGQRNYYAGHAAEDVVARAYIARGYQMRDRRWRGETGEIDLVFSRDDSITFVEVKTSKGFGRAALALGERQIRRLTAAASEYVGALPAGQDTDMRFDVALVDGAGRVQVVENALGA